MQGGAVPQRERTGVGEGQWERAHLSTQRNVALLLSIPFCSLIPRTKSLGQKEEETGGDVLEEQGPG